MVTLLILLALVVIAYFIFKPKPKPPVTTTTTLCINSIGSVCTLTLNNVFVGLPQAVFTINPGFCS